MTALAPEALSKEEIVELARKQMAAFNSGDWEQLGAGLAPTLATTSLEPSGRSAVRPPPGSASRVAIRAIRTSPRSTARLKFALGCPCAVTTLQVGPDGETRLLDQRRRTSIFTD